MKKWRLPRLSRGWKTIRNLTVTALWLVLLWGLVDYPLGVVGDFRRAERSNWVGPSDIQRVGENYGIVGTYEDQVVVQNGRYSLSYWPRSRSGPTLLPLEEGFLAVDVPEGTVRAELTLELSFYYFPSLSEPSDVGPTYAVRERAEAECEQTAQLWQDVYVTEGELLKEGGILFSVEPKGPEIPEELGVWDGHPLWAVMNWDTYEQSPWDNEVCGKMEAVFYNENGEALGWAALSTPEGETTNGW